MKPTVLLLLIAATASCKEAKHQAAPPLNCEGLDSKLARVLLPATDAHKTAVWSPELDAKLRAQLVTECKANHWSLEESIPCLSHEGDCSSKRATEQRDRTRAVIEATIHELEQQFAKPTPLAGAIGSPLPEVGPHPDYPTPIAAGTDKIFSMEDPDRGPKVSINFAVPPRDSLTWTRHAHCDDDRTGIVCSAAVASTDRLWSWRVGRSATTVVGEAVRGDQVYQTLVYVAKPDGTPERRVKLDAYGRVEDVLSFATGKFTGRRPTGANALAGCGSMAFTAGATGRIETLGCRQWVGEPMRDLNRVATTRFVRDAKGLVTEELRLGLDGTPISKNDGVPHMLYERDADGDVIVERYRDGDDKPMAAKSGCYGQRTERDARGTETRTTCLGADDKPIIGVSGTSVDVYRADARGCRVELRHMNPDGTTPAVNHDGVHGLSYVAGEKCAAKQRTCLDTAEHPRACGVGEPARFAETRDPFGNVTSIKHYGTDLQPGDDPVNKVFEVRNRYDAVGNRIAQDYHDVSGRLMFSGTGSGLAGERVTYDDAGRAVETRFIDDQGKPGTNLGAAVRLVRYDNYDHAFETRHLDPKGEPFEIMGQAIRRDLYDVLHRQFAILLLDPKGKPAKYTACYTGVVCPVFPWHAVRIVRRSDGSVEQNLFFDEAGQLKGKNDCKAVRCFD